MPGKRTGSRTPSSAPRNVYLTKDDRWVAIAGSTQAITERLFREMGREDRVDDPRFRTNRDRLVNVEALDEIVSAWVSQRTQADVIEQLVKPRWPSRRRDFKHSRRTAILARRRGRMTIRSSADCACPTCANLLDARQDSPRRPSMGAHKQRSIDAWLTSAKSRLNRRHHISIPLDPGVLRPSPIHMSLHPR